MSNTVELLAQAQEAHNKEVATLRLAISVLAYGENYAKAADSRDDKQLAFYIREIMRIARLYSSPKGLETLAVEDVAILLQDGLGNEHTHARQ